MSMSERQKMYDHVHELEELEKAIPHLNATARIAIHNPIIRLVEYEAIMRLVDAANAVREFIDPYVEVEDKPNMTEHFSEWDEDIDPEISITDPPNGATF